MVDAPAAFVDVRDMLCAQALALVAQALGRVRLGGSLHVRVNAEDVRHDLLVWARERGHGTRVDGTRIVIERRPGG